MKPLARPIAVRYAIVLATFTVAAGVRWALVPVFGQALPYITFYPGIMLCAWYGGLWPGILMTALGAVAAVTLWPVGALESAISVISLALFVFNGTAISGLTELLHRARSRENELHERTQRHEAEVERLLELERDARTSAEKANRAKDDFLATVSHELRTPLTAIVGWVSILQRQQFGEEKWRHAIEIIGRSAKLQAQLVTDLLDVSRIIAGKLSVERNEIDVARVVQEALDSLQEAARAESLQLTARLEPGAVWVVGDAVRLHQVVANLCSNAIKFTPPGGRIDVVLEPHQGSARLVVKDTGEGIADEDLQRIFGRFEQGAANSSGRRKGLGLGLAICRYLVEAHGGRISAHSAGKEQGAAFTVELPLLAVRGEAGAGATGAPVRAGAGEPDLSGLRVLVVDDYAEARETIGVALRGYGADVLQAASASEALDILHRETTDLLVSDIAMPQTDGYSFIASVRALEQSTGAAPIPAIALTAYGSAEDREQALAAGFHVHLVKPIDPAELAAVVRTLFTFRPSAADAAPGSSSVKPAWQRSAR